MTTYRATGGLWEHTTLPTLSGRGRWQLVPGEFLPDAYTTGVDPAITLSVIDVPTIVATPGSTFYNTRFRDRVYVRTSGVRFINCRFEGPGYAVDGAIVDATHPAVSALVFEDCTFAPRTPSHTTHAFYGWRTTMRRVRSYGAVDSMSIIPPLGETRADVVVESCWFHGLSFYSPTNTQSDNITHNDAIQWQGMLGVTIRGSRLEGFVDPAIGDASTPPTGTWPGSHTGGNPWLPNMWSTSVLMCAPARGPMGELTLVDNWIDGGRVALNLGAAGLAQMPNVGTITGNRFGYNYGLGVDYAVFAHPSQVIDLHDNYRWNYSDPFDASIPFNVRKSS